jgi:membrane-bound lytic murein transglycosylase D
MKKTILLVTCCLIAATTILASDDEVEARLRHMDCIVSIKSDASVISRIQSLLHGRKETEKMIGRSSTYFPIFDQYLKEYNLPSDLKYITCLETELDNKTISSSGAKGIWQLMPDVREEFGLRIDGALDERLDIYRGTEAALKDLKRMFKAYSNWELALAGYNCGVGRLADAMKKAKSKDFDRVKAFLPKQTQEYIAKFIAFTYLMKNYRFHGLKVNLPLLDAQMVGSVKVFNYLSLSTVASITGVSYEMIKELNYTVARAMYPILKMVAMCLYLVG